MTRAEAALSIAGGLVGGGIVAYVKFWLWRWPRIDLRPRA